MKQKVILFDLDGTITDPKIGITKSFQYALQHFGIQVNDLDALEPVIGPPLKKSFSEFYHLPEEQIDSAIEKYRERFSNVGLYENEIYDGMESLLRELSEKGFILEIASSKPTIFVEKICEHFKIKQYFTHIVGSFLDGRRGEKEEVVEEAIRLSQATPDNIVMIGDRVYDVLGAHAKGISVIGVSYGYGGRKELEEAGADVIVDMVEQLRQELLGRRI